MRPDRLKKSGFASVVLVMHVSPTVIQQLGNAFLLSSTNRIE